MDISDGLFTIYDIFCCSTDKEIGELLIETAISRAYHDAVDRVLIKEGYNKENENGWIKNRKAAENIVKNHINQLMDGNFNFELAKENAPEKMKNDSEARNFDYWHWSLTNELAIKINENNVTTFSCGIAQKWINMTLKYLHVWDNCFLGDIFQYCHVPLDNYILDISKKEFGIDKPPEPWSKWDDEQYQEYQEGLREKIKEKKANTKFVGCEIYVKLMK